MAVALALVAALCWGGSDYAAGIASRRWSAHAVVVLTHLFACGTLLLFAPGLPPVPGPDQLAWGALAGGAGGVGALLLFRGLSGGAMAVVAPITAAGAACLPVLFEVVTGDEPTVRRAVGFAVAVAAIALASGAALPRRRDRGAAGRRALPPGVGLGLLAGLGFGLFFVFLGQTNSDAQLWPLFSARVASVVLLGIGLVFTRRQRAERSPQRWFYAWCAGILDALAGAAFLLSTFTGSLSVVAMLSSLYPGITVLLAWKFDRERFSRSQLAGIYLAAASISLLA